MKESPIRVLIANDSPVELELLRQIIGQDPLLQVVATSRDGVEAVEAACRERPDVIAMDVYMPRLDGIGATRKIMECCPTRIVIVTASSSYLQEGAKSFRALELGALALVATPRGPPHPDHAAATAELVETLKRMSEVKVVRRWAPAPPQASAPAVSVRRVPVRLVAVGASAGGPPAIRYLLASLPKDFSVPVLIVQHMAPGFIEGFATWLRQVTGLPISVAVEGERPLPDRAYLAPSDRHMGLTADGRIALADTPPEGGLRPAISYLFRSVAAVYGAQAIGVLLSGMGTDGAAELKAMRAHGAVTIAQDEATAIVYGMPGEAVRIGGASHELPLECIPGLVTSVVAGSQSP